MAWTVRKSDRGSLSRRDPSLVTRAAAAFETVTSGDALARFESPSKELLNKVLLTLGIRALVTGIALTLIAPTVTVFVGVNLLFGVPVVVQYLYRRHKDARDRRLGGRAPTVPGRLWKAARSLTDRSSRSSDRL